MGINWQTGFESSWQRALPGETERRVELCRVLPAEKVGESVASGIKTRMGSSLGNCNACRAHPTSAGGKGEMAQFSNIANTLLRLDWQECSWRGTGLYTSSRGLGLATEVSIKGVP